MKAEGVMLVGRVRWMAVAALGVVALASVRAQQVAPSAGGGKALTVQRIYSQPSMNGKLTRGLAWTPSSKQISYFESKGAGKEAHSEFWVLDAGSGERQILISSDKLESALPAELTKKTQATGLGRHAPAEYRWSPKGDALLFVGTSSLAWYDVKTQTAKTLTSGKEAIADAKISPDGRTVSFVRAHNVWLVDLASGTERALTKGGTEEIRKGELDWVYPEELEIQTAYWWAPDSSAIAYLEMNESKVSQFPLVDFNSFDGRAEMQRYPVAGGANPIVHVYVAPVSGGAAKLMDTGAQNEIYIPRVNWLPDSRQLAIQRLNRPQTVLELLLAEASSGKSRVVLTDKDDYWINLSDDLHFLKDGKRFLWSSERSGYRHIYLYGIDGKQQAQLTRGEWEATGIEGVDEAKGIVYFRSTEKSPLERQLYKVGLDGSGFSRITKADGTHATTFAPDASAFIDTFSDSATPPRQDLYRADGGKISSINENHVAELADYHLSPVEFLSVKTHDGIQLNAMMIKPPDFNPERRYPVLVYTYGGPHAQVVTNQWQGPTYLWHQSMAQKGYIVFAVDNRGSAGRGHLFEEFIHYRLGAQEMSDQRDGVTYLKGLPFVDPARIGIWGWSYGGHMVLHAMFEDPEDFKAAFAGGPVSDWHYYDSIYTERYLGLLPEHDESYEASSPIENAKGLRGKLLIAHGTGDDNVHFSNTLRVIDELLETGKAAEVMPFPGRGHGVSDPEARRVLFQRVTQFFIDNL
ncbi:MAG TPA: S9 family peptidase [Candidatus Saccharimonadales bacterium]|nr:S9 family peptidase [Candidatus Saccharimonadales bacterium]